MSITFVPYNEIDKKKWDHCVQHALNGLIYGRSFYLDTMAANWDALILNDYEAIMPLTWEKKWGIRYLYQPAFTQQGGIFYTRALPEEQLRSFIDAALKKFKFAEFTLNFDNKAETANTSYQTSQRNNFILDINRPYQELYDNYDPAFTKSLRRIKKFDMVYATSVNFHKTISLYKYLYGSRLPFFTSKSYDRFEKVCKKLFKENGVIVRHARNSNNDLLASVVFLKDEKRLYNIISCITTKGKQQEANYFLYDHIIEEFANTGLILDFEGSDIEGIAGFYKKFNPENQSYPYIRYNNLPAIIRMFKS